MSRFTYSQEEYNINKILKVNHDEALAMLTDEEFLSKRKNTDGNIESSKVLLESIGKGRIVENIDENKRFEKYNLENCMNIPKLETWNEILDSINQLHLENVELEDFLTEEDINDTFTDVEEINEIFSRKTSIKNKTDLIFLMIATALQVAKTALYPVIAKQLNYGEKMDIPERKEHNDPSIVKAHKEANDKFRDKHIKNHEPGKWINILYQTVPYDITKGSPDIGINMHGKYHRMYTLGHDPILGWIFGTANILTDSITFNNFQTNRILRIDPLTKSNKMIITPEIVPLLSMFNECYGEVKANPLNLIAAIFAQSQHLKSDKYTKLGLPIPIISSIHEVYASKLYRDHYDLMCLERDTISFSRDAMIVAYSYKLSHFIDTMIIAMHGLFRKSDENSDLYDVRTRKILLISNSIATSSSIITAYISENPKNLDIGGLLNTISRIFLDGKFLMKIKEEFIKSELDAKLQKEIDEVDALYERFFDRKYK
ncbi:hypothetical protein ASN88_00740 [Streptococcus parauberis]|uniref:hypothetical protein n=1 Tax=Streptococcus parauberis TaxID=1348 RepID=UPI000CCF8239|nr:hypothetical protein [Streptococcus parauberis]PNY22118.1 hypothetical protein ASN88_00740 [Streptococcus parauberis]